jgi:hypothetical protein
MVSPPQPTEFEPGSVYVGFVVNKVALRQAPWEYFYFLNKFSFHRLLC